jgi:hypothetical protein
MLEHREVDLEGNFGLYLLEWDGVLRFAAYSVSIIPATDCSVELVKN